MRAVSRISTCLWFDAKGEEAAQLYVSLIPNSRIVSIARYGAGGRMPEGLAMLVRFELDGVSFSALNGGPIFAPSEAASIVVACRDQSEIDHLWSALTANGGKPTQCGWLKDRFGVSWQIIPAMLAPIMDNADPQALARVMSVLMPMTKIDIAAIETAYGQKEITQ
jgi:predicted 3-demethylubiquinone-9 3-methyltransferase (glyoxalase superfamily)